MNGHDKTQHDADWHLAISVPLALAGVLLTAACAVPVDPCPAGAASCDEPARPAGGKADHTGSPEHPPPVERRPHGESFMVIGAPEAVGEAVADLEELDRSHVGRAILAFVDEAARELEGRVKVRARSGDVTDAASCVRVVFARGGYQGRDAAAREHETRADGTVVVLEPGIPVPPPDLRIYYHRACLTDGLPAECAPPHVYLAHELLHVGAAMRGTLLHHVRDPNDYQDQHPTVEESRAIGLGAYAGAALSENALRDELGLPRRDTHARFCPAAPDTPAEG